MDDRQTGMGKVIAMQDLADYQEGSVVSREIIKKKEGTVTFFAFDKGQGLSEHTTPYHALVNVIEGQAEITISGQTSIVRGGEIIIMPAHQPHALQAKERFKMLLVLIKG